MRHMQMMDTYGRHVSYLRLSVTDRCNLRCFYCRKKEDLQFIPHNKILRYEEMLRLIHAVRDLGVSKVRLTGGEPFVRREFLGFLEQACTLFPEMDFRLTTNGTYLSNNAERLRRMGLQYVNISLDTLDRQRYAEITGRDMFDRVWEGIHAALAAGLRVKLNAVALRSFTAEELEGFIAFALQHPVDVRFIEFMPIGAGTSWEEGQYWSAEELVAAAQAVTPLEPVRAHDCNHGPARMYKLLQGQGRLGVISPLSDHFCAQCNRLRVTPDGRLRTCLFSDKEYRLRPHLRHPKLGPEHLRRLLAAANAHKPMGYELLQAKKDNAVCQRGMSAIGG